MKKNVAIVLLLLGSLLLFGFNLGDLGLLKGDENYYFSSARRMIREGDWVTPRYHHHIRFEKPILYYWVVALFFKVFGVSWATARLTSVLFGVLTVLITYLLGTMLLTRRKALISSVMLATSFIFFAYSRVAVIDMMFLFFVTSSLFLFIKGVKENERGYFLLSFITLGLSVLAKGPLGLVVVGLIIASYIIKTKRYRLIGEMNIVLGVFALLLIVLPWPLLMYEAHGQDYFNHIWEVETINKAVGSVLKLSRIDNPVWFAVKYIGYYIPVVIFSFAPWGLFLPFGLFKKIEANADEDRFFIKSWFWVVFLFFTLVSFKHTHYMLLLSPPLCMVVASLLPKKIPAVIASVTFAAYLALTGFLLPAFDDGALRLFSLKITSEIEKDEEVGIASRNFNLKKLGIYLNNLISTPFEPSGDDLAQYRLVTKEGVAPFLESKKRVFCLITKDDYIKYVPEELRKRLYILETNPIWKRVNLKRSFRPILELEMGINDFKEEAYLISNRRR